MHHLELKVSSVPDSYGGVQAPLGNKDVRPAVGGIRCVPRSWHLLQPSSREGVECFWCWEHSSGSVSSRSVSVGALPRLPFHYGRSVHQHRGPPPPASISEPASASHKQDFVVSVFKHASRQQRPRTSLTKHRHQVSHGPEFHARSCLLRASRITRAPRPVSTRRPRCALSRLPGGGGCDGGSGGVSGSGRTCDLAGLPSGVGCPGPSPHHGCLRPPQLTRGHCCMEGSHCLPADSWCCTLEKEQHSLRTQTRLSRALECTPVIATFRGQHLHMTSGCQGVVTLRRSRGSRVGLFFSKNN